MYSQSLLSISRQRLITICILLLSFELPATEHHPELRVITSADTESNQAASFIVIPEDKLIPHGISRDAPQDLLALQIPFIAELKSIPASELEVQWKVVVPHSQYGEIQLLTKFNGTQKHTLQAFSWQSVWLDSSVKERHKLVFRPRAHRHQPVMYKKGKGRNNKRRQYGGGTVSIDKQMFNPRLSYHVFVDLKKGDQIINRYQTLIQMDNKDMIRQEYINHYGIQRYGRGDNGNLPIPRRDEITLVPDRPAQLLGNPLTESDYDLIINDGIMALATQVADIFERQKNHYQNHGLHDLNNKPLPVPQSKLWLSGGWRNPERNEWFSNATNGIHQRGGAIDLIPNEAPGSRRSAIAYWVLWNSLQAARPQLQAFWQLETNGRPMRTDEYRYDIEPQNGIPDAFDKADHLHINIDYASR